jgi:hypothetical protein
MPKEHFQNKMAATEQDNESLEMLLSDSDYRQEQNLNPNSHRQKRYCNPIVLLLLGAIFSSMIWTFGVFSFEHNSTLPSSSSRHCGASSSEALALGCKFQLWSFSWVPSACFDSMLQSSFLEQHAKEKWGYFTDLDGQNEVELDTVIMGDRNDLFSTWGQHYWHCAFYQRKFFRILEGSGVERTNRDLDYHHSIHCQEWLADPFKYEWNKVNINLTVGYNQCKF